MKKETIQELLLRSFDQPLTAEEKAQLDTALEHSAELRREKEQLSKMRQMLESLRTAPRSGFTEGVMERLSTSPVEASLLSMLPRAAAACLIILVITLIGIYMTEGSLSTEAIIGVNNLAPEDAYTYLEY